MQLTLKRAYGSYAIVAWSPDVPRETRRTLVILLSQYAINKPIDRVREILAYRHPEVAVALTGEP